MVGTSDNRCVCARACVCECVFVREFESESKREMLEVATDCVHQRVPYIYIYIYRKNKNGWDGMMMVALFVVGCALIITAAAGHNGKTVHST